MDKGRLSVARVTGGAVTEYIGENDNVPGTTLELGNINFDLRKLAAYVPVSNSVLRYSPILGESVIRNDLLEAAAATEDGSFIRGDGATHKPLGLRYRAPDAHVFSADPSATFDNVVVDLEKLMAALEDARVPMRRPGWIFSNRTRRFLATLRDNAGGFAFRDEISRGVLFGWPVGATEGVPSDLGGGGNESEIILADFNEVAIGQGSVEVAASQQTAYLENSILQSAFSKDMTVVRLLYRHDISARHAEAIAVLTEVTWGA